MTRIAPIILGRGAEMPPSPAAPLPRGRWPFAWHVHTSLLSSSSPASSPPVLRADLGPWPVPTPCPHILFWEERKIQCPFPKLPFWSPQQASQRGGGLDERSGRGRWRRGAGAGQDPCRGKRDPLLALTGETSTANRGKCRAFRGRSPCPQRTAQDKCLAEFLANYCQGDGPL